MEWFTTDDGKYKIVSLTAATFPGALDIIREDFCQDESVCIGTEVNKNPLAAEELLELCADAAIDGASLVAVAVDSGEVAAVAFNKLQVSSSTEKPFFEIFAEERCTQTSSRALIEFMAEVDGTCNFFEKFQADCSLEIMFLGTQRAHRNRKLGTILCKYSIEVAKKLKTGPVSSLTLDDLGQNYSSMKPRDITTKYPKFCQALWTSIATQKIGKKLGFTVHLRVSFEQFTYNGKSYVERIGYDPFCEAVAMSLY
ncbi:uncharacterized protein LOC114247525 isoform X2 [Bombyx mandarina]|uniref:Uncharacterized protein LOC114247525 isoform X2 n=1 Tax=Bombyx mandarina TaxID=7092 RepID=A0A6J2K5S3_BOMMA|nr:uncharacterized protein LOC114247525 isoform X2 [Bombyx mandarina]